MCFLPVDWFVAVGDYGLVCVSAVVAAAAVAAAVVVGSGCYGSFDSCMSVTVGCSAGVFSNFLTVCWFHVEAVGCSMTLRSCVYVVCCVGDRSCLYVGCFLLCF